MIERLCRIDDPSISHRDDTVGMCSDIQAMCHHYYRHSCRAEPLNQFEEPAGRCRIEAPSRFVCQQNLRIVGEGTGNGHTLPLTAG